MFDSLREKECGCACVRERLCVRVGVHACVHACMCVCVCVWVCMHAMRVCVCMYGYAVNLQHLFSC